MFVTFPIRYDIDKSDPTKEAANLTDTYTGYDCYMVENPSDIAHGMWSNNESMKSSTWKELTAVKNILFSIDA
jgi:hypothetical protein